MYSVDDVGDRAGHSVPVDLLENAPCRLGEAGVAERTTSTVDEQAGDVDEAAVCDGYCRR